MNAELHIDQKPVQRSVDFRVRRRVDNPGAAAVFFTEGNVGERRRQTVIFDGQPSFVFRWSVLLRMAKPYIPCVEA